MPRARSTLPPGQRALCRPSNGCTAFHLPRAARACREVRAIHSQAGRAAAPREVRVWQPHLDPSARMTGSVTCSYQHIPWRREQGANVKHNKPCTVRLVHTARISCACSPQQHRPPQVSTPLAALRATAAPGEQAPHASGLGTASRPDANIKTLLVGPAKHVPSRAGPPRTLCHARDQIINEPVQSLGGLRHAQVLDGMVQVEELVGGVRKGGQALRVLGARDGLGLRHTHAGHHGLPAGQSPEDRFEWASLGANKTGRFQCPARPLGECFTVVRARACRKALHDFQQHVHKGATGRHSDALLPL